MTWQARYAWPYHEWTYEAMVHDLLPVSPLVGRCRLTL